MSKLTDYSKFDHLRDDDDEEEEQEQMSTRPAVEPIPPPPQEAPLATTTRDPITNRYIFSYNNTKVYEWEQSLDEVNMYIPSPPQTRAAEFHITIASKRLSVGLRGHDRLFIDEPTYSLVNVSESSWYLDDDDDDDATLCIVLVKGHRGETWESALRGREAAVHPALKEEMKKDMLLERFQEEHPGMDFRGAQVNGAVPDPRTFMGGLGAG
jgi:CS domain